MDTEYSSDSETETEQEGLDTILSDLKVQMEEIEANSNELTTHVVRLFQRAKRETVDLMQEPLMPKASIRAWCAEHGLSGTPTLQEFIDSCLSAAIFLDLETRIATFKKEDAEILWKGKRRISVFELVSLIPTLFH
jgi:hypothetical protein